MTASNSTTREPDETTSLLKKGQAIDTGTGVSHGNAVVEGEDADVENGTVGNGTVDGEGGDDDPSSNPRTQTRMGLLIPAVAIGVSFWIDF